MEKDYTALLDELREGTLDKLEINTEEFMDFQKAFMNYSHRKNIVGTAKRGGGGGEKQRRPRLHR